MRIYSSLRINKTVEMNDRLTTIWNNLVGAMSIVNGAELPHHFFVNNPYDVLRYTTPEFVLNFNNHFGHANIMFRCDSNFVNDLGGALEIVAVTTSALEYVVDREDCLAIEEWRFTFGDLEDRYQDVGIDSIADMLGTNKERAIDLFEKHVEPKLDEIEGYCL